MLKKVEIPLCGFEYDQHDNSALAFSYHKAKDVVSYLDDSLEDLDPAEQRRIQRREKWMGRRTMGRYAIEGQMFFEPLENVRINSETSRLIQFEARSLGRLAVGFYSPATERGELDLQDLPPSHQGDS